MKTVIKIYERKFLLDEQNKEDLRNLFNATKQLPDGTKVGELGEHSAIEIFERWTIDMVRKHHYTIEELNKIWLDEECYKYNWDIKSSNKKEWFDEEFYTNRGIATSEIDWDILNELFTEYNLNYKIEFIEEEY